MNFVLLLQQLQKNQNVDKQTSIVRYQLIVNLELFKNQLIISMKDRPNRNHNEFHEVRERGEEVRDFIPLTLPYAGGHHPEQQKEDLPHAHL